MTAEQQLERSVLEGKERDELHAIAQALSVKTNTRTKKADMIDGILKATGVSVDSPPADKGATNGDATAAANGDGGGSAPSASRRRSAGSRSAAATTSDEGAATGSSPTAGPAGRTGGRAPAVHSFGPADDVGSDGGSVDLDDDFGEVAVSDSAGSNGQANGQQKEFGWFDQPRGHPGANGWPTRRGWRTSGRIRPAETGRGTTATTTATTATTIRTTTRTAPTRTTATTRAVATTTSATDAATAAAGAATDKVAGEPKGISRASAATRTSSTKGELIPVSGLLDLRDEGYGFLRCEGYLPSNKDVYVSISQARRFALRKGDRVEGFCRPAGSTEKYPALLQIDTVSSLDPEVARNRPRFEDLTPLFPDERLHLETPGDKENLTARIVDLLSPIGKGQRGLIVSPPKAGKTTVMKHIAHSIEANNPDVHLMVLLVDERPEEVTDMRRSVKGEVVASTFDRPSEEHTAVAELAIERAKRLVEAGRDVVIILDGITRLARAYNLAQPATGRIMSGGVDSGALYPPKRFFGAARNIEEGGSLTILATALVETGSKMDEVIFEEFKGTGNMELRLDRRLAERRLYPSIDVNASSTRHEELLFDRSQLQQVWKLRRVLNALANEGSAAAGLELLMDKIRTTKSNDEFLAEIAKGPAT